MLNFVKTSANHVGIHSPRIDVYIKIAYAARVCYASENIGNYEDIVIFYRSDNLIPKKIFHTIFPYAIFIDSPKISQYGQDCDEARKYFNDNTVVYDISRAKDQDIPNISPIHYPQTTALAKDEDLIRRCIANHHESVIEHINLSYNITCDRGVSHELVRHRIASYSQESTRYVKYSDSDGRKGIKFINPFDPEICDEKVSNADQDDFFQTLTVIQTMYLTLLDNGISAQTARSILPNATATKIFMTANLREWRAFLKLRLNKAAHPAIRKVARDIYTDIKTYYPVFVEDITING